MYPNQSQPLPTPPPLDYLNQIAPQAPQRHRFTRMQMMILGIVGGLVIVTIILCVIAASAGNNKQTTQRLAARLITTATIATDAQTKLKSTELRALNSSLQLYLTNTNRDIVAPLTTQGVTIAKLNKDIVKSESGTATLARLEDARLNAVYDNTYAREMGYQLSTVLTLMQQIYNNTGNKDLKSFLQTAVNNLTPIQKQLLNFNATNS